MIDIHENSPNTISSKKYKPQNLNSRKSIVTIDLSSEDREINKIEENAINKRNEIHLKECYDIFKRRIDVFELSDKINKTQANSDLDMERIKSLLNDWIFWTSRLVNNTSDSLIDQDDIDLFKNYLLYLLIYLNDFEKSNLIMRIFKRLIEKNGNIEWAECYKDILMTLQTNFYEKFNFTIKLN
jgi:hypothetical protein